MATKNVSQSAALLRGKQKRQSQEAARPRRASQRRAIIEINLAERSLRDLMIEQCRNGDGYLTVYRGSRSELITAGVPEQCFPIDGAESRFDVKTLNVCCTGSREILSGVMRSLEAGQELEIDWGTTKPYVQGGHPALNELARMLLKDIMAWTTSYPWRDKPDLAHPIDIVASDPRADDYKPNPDAPRFELTPEFHAMLAAQASQLYELVHRHGEILLSTRDQAPTKQKTVLKLVSTSAFET